MKFEQYERKMKKIKRVKNGFYHMRFPILGFTLAALITGTAISACVGLVQEADSLNSTYVYGDEIKLEGGSAFLSDVNYQYRRKGDENWTDVAPSDAGEYEYRTVTTNVFGQEKHGDIHQFKIAKATAKFEITSDKVTYGEEPWFALPILENGDQVVSYDFSYDSFEEMQTNVCMSNIKIMDKTGKIDKSESYDIQTPKKHIAFRKRLLTLHFDGIEGQYNGEEYKVDYDPKPFGLLETDRIEYLTNPSLIEVGNISALREAKIYNKDNVDVTHLYDIDASADNIHVLKRNITLVGTTLDKVYDSRPAQVSADYQEGSSHIMANHYFDTHYINEGVYKVGTHKTVFSVNVKEVGTDRDVTHLYNINCLESSYKITKKPLTIITGSDKKYYGQGSANSTKIQAHGLEGHDALKYESSPAYNSFGQYENAITYSIVRDGVDVTDCYEITNKFGTLNYVKRPITVRLNNAISKVYDGTPLTIDSSNFKILGPKESNGASLGLAPNHVAVPVDNFKKTIINVDHIDCKDFRVNIYEKDPETGVINYDYPLNYNYEIEYDCTGYAEITKREIHVKTPDIKKTYDGKPIYSTKPILVSGSSLGSGDIFESINLNSYMDSNSDVPEKDRINDSIDIKIINEAKANVTHNYDIIVDSYGTVDIGKKQILVEPEDIVKTYDARNYEVSNANLVYSFAPDDIPLDEKLTVTANVKCEQIDATKGDEKAKIDIDLDTVAILNAQNVDITHNFVITNKVDTQNGLTIEQQFIEPYIRSEDYALESHPNYQYEDDLLNATDLRATDRFANVQYCEFGTDNLSPSTPTLAKEVVLGVKSFEIHNDFGEGRDVTENYYYDSLEDVKGTFKTHTDRPVYISSCDVTRTYNGEYVELTEGEKKVHASGIDPRHKLVTKFEVGKGLMREYKDVQDTAYYNEDKQFVGYTGQNYFTFRIIDRVTLDTVDPSVYQDLRVTYGTVKILPREIAIGGKINNSLVYDGNTKYVPNLDDGSGYGFKVSTNKRSECFIRQGSLLPDVNLYVENFGGSAEYGTIDRFANAKFTIRNAITGETSDRISRNYHITKSGNSGNVNIQKIKVYVYMQSYDGIFDYEKDANREPQFINDPKYTRDNMVYGHQLKMEPTAYYSMTDGPVYNTLTWGQYSVVDDYGDEVIDWEEKYDIIVIDGIVNIYDQYSIA